MKVKAKYEKGKFFVTGELMSSVGPFGYFIQVTDHCISFYIADKIWVSFDPKISIRKIRRPFFQNHNFESSPILINFVFITSRHFSRRPHLKFSYESPKYLSERKKNNFLKFLEIPFLRSPHFKALQCLLTIIYLQRMLYSIIQLFYRVE